MRQRPDAIHPRLICWIFAAVAWVGGLVLLAIGPRGLDGPDAPIRFLGGLLIADGCLAAGLGGVSQGRSQAQAARWFAAGHVAAITVLLFLQESLVGRRSKLLSRGLPFHRVFGSPRTRMVIAISS